MSRDPYIQIPGAVFEQLVAYVEIHQQPQPWLILVLMNDVRCSVRVAGIYRSCIPAIFDWLEVEAPGKSWGSVTQVTRWLNEESVHEKSA